MRSEIFLNLHVKVRGMRWLRARVFIGSLLLRAASAVLGRRFTIDVDYKPRVDVRAVGGNQFEARVQ